MQIKIFPGDPEERNKFPGTDEETKSEFGKFCEDSSWNHCVSTSHSSETNGIAERAVRKVKDGRIPWNVAAICETFKIFCLMGRHHTKGGSENYLTDQLYRLVQWSNITLFLRKTYRDYINLVLKSCQENSSVTSCMRGKTGMKNIMIADIQDLEEMDASELHARRLNAEEVLTPMKGDNFIFPVADGTVKIYGGDRRLRTSTLIRDHPERGEEQEVC